jgi:hypothetical protein
MKPDAKKSFPGGFFLVLLAAILIILGIQTFTSNREATVSFSHQVEHLINLDLTVPEENRKIAQNENLVTFSGRFRPQLESDSMDRYRFLELLQAHHTFTSEANQLTSELDSLQKNVREAADLFLHLSGIPLSRSGYTVVGAAHDTLDRDSSIVVKQLSDKDIVNLPMIQKAFSLAQSQPSFENAEVVGKELREFVSQLRSPALGIGNEEAKGS